MLPERSVQMILSFVIQCEDAVFAIAEIGERFEFLLVPAEEYHEQDPEFESVREDNEVLFFLLLRPERLFSESCQPDKQALCAFACRKGVPEDSHLIAFRLDLWTIFEGNPAPVLLYYERLYSHLDIGVYRKPGQHGFQGLDIAHSRRCVQAHIASGTEQSGKHEAQVMCLPLTAFAQGDRQVHMPIDALVHIFKGLGVSADDHFRFIHTISFLLVFLHFCSRLRSMNPADGKKTDEFLMVLRDRDIFPAMPEPGDIAWKDRPTGKVVLFDGQGRVALIGNRVNDFFLLPGGGIEDGESVRDGALRECQEETGCTIELLRELGATEDFRSRDQKHCISYGYSARMISQGSPSLTSAEADVGAYVKWFALDEAQALFADQEEKVKRGEVKFYNTCFNILRDALFIRRAAN